MHKRYRWHKLAYFSGPFVAEYSNWMRRLFSFTRALFRTTIRRANNKWKLRENHKRTYLCMGQNVLKEDERLQYPRMNFFQAKDIPIKNSFHFQKEKKKTECVWWLWLLYASWYRPPWFTTLITVNASELRFWHWSRRKPVLLHSKKLLGIIAPQKRRVGRNLYTRSRRGDSDQKRLSVNSKMVAGWLEIEKEGECYRFGTLKLWRIAGRNEEWRTNFDENTAAREMKTNERPRDRGQVTWAGRRAVFVGRNEQKSRIISLQDELERGKGKTDQSHP